MGSNKICRGDIPYFKQIQSLSKRHPCVEIALPQKWNSAVKFKVWRENPESSVENSFLK